MEIERQQFCTMIIFDFKCGFNEAQSLERFAQAFGDLAPSRATVPCAGPLHLNGVEHPLKGSEVEDFQQL